LPGLSLETPHATVYYNEGNLEQARSVGEAFELAYVHVNSDLGVAPSKRFRIYLYLCTEDLVEGLRTYSHLSAKAATAFANEEFLRPIDYVMHIPYDYVWHDVVHQYTHAIVDELSGTAHQSAKWLDEGLADYEAYVTVSQTQYSDLENMWKAELKASVYLQIESSAGLINNYGLIPLSLLSSEEQWGLNAASNRILTHAESYLTVDYLVQKYGIDKIKSVLNLMKQGQKQEQALEHVLGLTLSGLLFEDLVDYLVGAQSKAVSTVNEARFAVTNAEAEGRTQGLDHARALITEAMRSMEIYYEYKNATELANLAVELAQNATASPAATQAGTTVPPLGETTIPVEYGLLAGTVLMVALILTSKRKRGAIIGAILLFVLTSAACLIFLQPHGSPGSPTQCFPHREIIFMGSIQTTTERIQIGETDRIVRYVYVERTRFTYAEELLLYSLYLTNDLGQQSEYHHVQSFEFIPISIIVGC
jgi:hypothetical protein